MTYQQHQSARIGNFERQLWIFPLLKKSCILSTSFVFDQDLEKSGGRLMLAPSLELPEIASSGLTSAWIEGPNSIPKPVVDARIFPERKSYLYIRGNHLLLRLEFFNSSTAICFCQQEKKTIFTLKKDSLGIIRIQILQHLLIEIFFFFFKFFVLLRIY